MPRRNKGPRLDWHRNRKIWYIAWSERGRSRERSTGTRDRGEAELALAEFINASNRNAGPRDPAAVLVTDTLADYLQDRTGEVAAVDRIAAAVKAMVPFFTGVMVAAVTKEACRAYIKSRGKRSAGTIRRELGVLAAAINNAHREGRITRTVAVHLPHRPDPRDRWLTRKEAAGLVRAALREPRVRLYLPLFILTALYTASRKEAILALRWPQVDLDAGRIDFNAPGARRTNKRRAKIPIPRKLLGHLRRARARGTEVGFVIEDNGIRLRDVKRGFASACRRAGLNGVTPHVLKHTAITWLCQRGVPIWEIAGFTATSRETIERVYGHHCPDYLKSAAEALG
jgi:integrase